MRTRIGTVWSRPRATGADGPKPRDVALVTTLAAVSIIEGAVRTDLAWPLATVLVTIAILPALLWRRTHPLAAVAFMTFATSAFALSHAIAGIEPNALVTSVVLLAMPYALFRWGSGRDRIAGTAIVAVGLLFSSSLSGDPVAEAIAGIVFMGSACLIGALRRERGASRARQLDTVRAREREALARDLHDMVAHHVSAIVIRAQVANADPRDASRVAESLGVIESEAQAVLADMRSLVHTLRTPADYTPTPGLDELTRLADPGPPTVTVQVDGPADMPDIVASTVFRIAQEGITNARRHARAATGIEVTVTVGSDAVRVLVRDDGAPADPASGSGHGLLGMAERAALLGGNVEAGPDPADGWILRASLPLQGNP